MADYSEPPAAMVPSAPSATEAPEVALVAETVDTAGQNVEVDQDENDSDSGFEDDA
jgi:hypothetical protein